MSEGGADNPVVDKRYFSYFTIVDVTALFTIMFFAVNNEDLQRAQHWLFIKEKTFDVLYPCERARSFCNILKSNRFNDCQQQHFTMVHNAFSLQQRHLPMKVSFLPRSETSSEFLVCTADQIRDDAQSVEHRCSTVSD